MSKKKNTLKDLDEFLKQQAATLVAPSRLADEIQKPAETQPSIEKGAEITSEKILEDLRKLSVKENTGFRRNLYEIVLKSLEEQPVSMPEDKMLINTILYLKNGENWKEAIRQYWRNKS